MASDLIYQFKKHLGLKHDNPFTILEAKATESKPTKEVTDKEIAGYDYKNSDNLNNQIFDQYIKGLRFEMEQDPELLADEPTEALLKAKDIVLKNLKKDPIFYTKNAAFGVKDLGYEMSTEPKEPTGKHKSSGYGDLKENKMNKSTQLKELLEEAVAGIPSIGNPFAERKTEIYKDKFEAFLAEENKKETKEGKKEEDLPPPPPEAGGKGGFALEEEEPTKEEMTPKKEGKKQLKDVVKEVEKVAEMASNMVKMKEYKKQMNKLQETLTSINEDENLSEYIDEAKTKALQDEIKVYEQYFTKAEEAYNYSKNNK